MRETMRVGTRASALALAQARLVIQACQAVAGEDIAFEIVEMSTAGDRILDRPLHAFAGKGMFVTAFEEALAAGRIDVAVHSGKDMPLDMPPGLDVLAVLPRGNPRDVFVTVPGKPLPMAAAGEGCGRGTDGSAAQPGPAPGRLPADFVVGTSSLRRREQVRAFLGCGTKDIRGNVHTRLRKLLEGEVDGLILSLAGLERLSLCPGGMSGVCRQGAFVFMPLKVNDFLPAAAQGIIAVESTVVSPFAPLLARINDGDTMRCFLAERSYLAGVGAGCQQPVAAFSQCQGGLIQMEAAYWQDGKKYGFRGCDYQCQGEALGERLAKQTLQVLEQSGRG